MQEKKLLIGIFIVFLSIAIGFSINKNILKQETEINLDAENPQEPLLQSGITSQAIDMSEYELKIEELENRIIELEIQVEFLMNKSNSTEYNESKEDKIEENPNLVNIESIRKGETGLVPLEGKINDCWTTWGGKQVCR